MRKEKQPAAVAQPNKTSAKPVRKPGSMKGRIWMSPDFDAVDKEIEALFYGEDSEDPSQSSPAHPSGNS